MTGERNDGLIYGKSMASRQKIGREGLSCSEIVALKNDSLDKMCVFLYLHYKQIILSSWKYLLKVRDCFSNLINENMIT